MKGKTIFIILIIVILLMTTTNVSGAVYAFLRKLEEDNKVKLTAYDDGEGTWTIGFGSIYNFDQNRPVQQGDTIDQATAERWLELEANQHIAAVKNMVTVPISNNQLIALSSFAYNEGDSALRTSKLLSLLNAGVDIQTVADQFDRWIYAKHQINPGLINRRAAEKALFLS